MPSFPVEKRRYYIKLLGVDANNYQLKLSVSGIAAGSSSKTSARQIALNGAVLRPGPVSGIATYRGHFTTATKKDYYSVNLTRGQIVQLFTHDLGSDVDTVIELYRPDKGFLMGQPPSNHLLLRDDDGGPEKDSLGNSDRDSRLQFVAPVTGKYIVRVRQPEGAWEPHKGVSGGSGHYMLSVSIHPDDYSDSFPQLPGEE